MSSEKDEQPSSVTRNSNDDVASDKATQTDTTTDVPVVPKEEREPTSATEPKPRRPRAVKKKPVEEKEPPKEDPVVADPMFFAKLNTTLKMMVQQERRHRLSSMAVV